MKSLLEQARDLSQMIEDQYTMSTKEWFEKYIGNNYPNAFISEKEQETDETIQ